MTQQEVKPDNPAGRLYLVLTALTGAPGTQSIGQAWARVLGTTGGGYHRLLDRVGQVYALPFYVRRELEKLPSYDPSQKCRKEAHRIYPWEELRATAVARMLSKLRVSVILHYIPPERALQSPTHCESGRKLGAHG